MTFRSPRTKTFTGSVAAFLSLTLLASCASAVGERRAAAGGEQVDGGVVRIGTLADLRPKTLYAGTATAETTVTGLVYDTLTTYGHDSLVPRPRLAESWEIDGAGTTVTLHLRPGVRFHSGDPLTSGDVAASLSNYADPSHSGQLARTAALVNRVETTDPATAVLHLDHRVNNLFDLLSIVPVIRAADVDGFNAGTVFNGTGAFRFGTWHPGASLRFTADTGYWGGAPTLDGAELVTVPDERTLFSQLRSGQLDVVADASPRDQEILEDNDLFTVVDRTGVDANTYLGLDTASPALEDKRIRQAVGWAVDRDRILDEVFRGRGRADSLPWPTYSPAYDPDYAAGGTKAYRLDRDRARTLVEQVEQETGPAPEIPVAYAAGSQVEQNIAQILAADLADVGLRARLDPQEPGVMLDRLRGGTFGGIWVMGHGFSQFNPSTLTVSAFPFNSQKNGSNFTDPDYVTHTGDAWTVADPESDAARRIYAQVNDDLVENAFILELVAPDSPLITTAALHGVDWSKRSELDLADAYLTD